MNILLCINCFFVYYCIFQINASPIESTTTLIAAAEQSVTQTESEQESITEISPSSIIAGGNDAAANIRSPKLIEPSETKVDAERNDNYKKIKILILDSTIEDNGKYKYR